MLDSNRQGSARVKREPSLYVSARGVHYQLQSWCLGETEMCWQLAQLWQRRMHAVTAASHESVSLTRSFHEPSRRSGAHPLPVIVSPQWPASDAMSQWRERLVRLVLIADMHARFVHASGPVR